MPTPLRPRWAFHDRTPLPLEVMKLRTLQKGADDDATDPEIVKFASELARPHKPDDYAGIAKEIHAFVRDGIRYQRDPGLREEFESAGTVLRRGWDDCDGKSRLAVALARSLGLDADIQPVWRDGYLTHVQWRVRWPGSLRFAGNQNGWVIGELTIKGAELGQDPRTIPKNPETGKFPLSGGPG